MTSQRPSRRLRNKPRRGKIDVEGFELEVLQGGQRLFTESSPVLFLDGHNDFLRRRSIYPQTVAEVLRQYRYNSITYIGTTLPPQDRLEQTVVRLVCEKDECSASWS